LAEQLGDESLAAPPVNLLGRAQMIRGDSPTASVLLARSVEQMGKLGNRIEEAGASGMLTVNLGHLGRFAEALRAGDHALRVAEEIAHVPTMAACFAYRGQVRCWRGDWDGLKDFQRALELAQRVDDQFRAYLIHAGRGCWGYLLAGDLARAESELRLARSLAERLGTRFFLGGYLSALAYLRLRAGDADEALSLSRQMVQTSAQSGSEWEHSMALRNHARVLAGQAVPEIEEAEDTIARALSIQERLGMRWELTQSVLASGHILQRRHVAEAQRAFRRALGLFEEMGVTWGVAASRDAVAA
jgi:tetratricopeptide (TPR) repeat protein